jgi:hypothetical protein
MKNALILTALFLMIAIYSQSGSIITNLDIEQWYLNADLVIICSATSSKTDTLFYNNSPDIVNLNNLNYSIQTKYIIKTDSIIKGGESPEIIFTPEILTKTTKKRDPTDLSGNNKKNDSITVHEKEYTSTTNYLDPNSFKLDNHSSNLVILSKVDGRYIIVYTTKYDDKIKSLILEIKTKGN